MPDRKMIEAQLTEAMRAKDEVRKRTLRMVLSAIKLAEVEKRGPLDESGILAILQKEVKNRQEAIAEAEKAGRPDLAADAQAEIDLIKGFLPQALTPAEVEAIIRQVIAEADASSPADMGKVMKLITPKTQGRADNREVSQLVRKLLGG
jgi:uncharacterized protein YqeY